MSQSDAENISILDQENNRDGKGGAVPKNDCGNEKNNRGECAARDDGDEEIDDESNRDVSEEHHANRAEPPTSSLVEEGIRLAIPIVATESSEPLHQSQTGLLGPPPYPILMFPQLAPALPMSYQYNPYPSLSTIDRIRRRPRQSNIRPEIYEAALRLLENDWLEELAILPPASQPSLVHPVVLGLPLMMPVMPFPFPFEPYMIRQQIYTRDLEQHPPQDPHQHVPH